MQLRVLGTYTAESVEYIYIRVFDVYIQPRVLGTDTSEGITGEGLKALAAN